MVFIYGFTYPYLYHKRRLRVKKTAMGEVIYDIAIAFLSSLCLNKYNKTLTQIGNHKHERRYHIKPHEP